MNNEEKQAFWLNYGTQKVFRSHFDGLRYPYFGVHSDDGKFDCELRSFDQLDISELIQISIIKGIINFENTTKHFNRLIDILESTFLKKSILNDLMTIELVDYLRSIGVLVGFRQFTPKILIAEGVVKIKE